MFKKAMESFFKATQGRHTGFAVFFAVTGTLMQFMHRLDGNFIALVTVIQGWVFARSFSEDKTQRRDDQAIVDTLPKQ